MRIDPLATISPRQLICKPLLSVCLAVEGPAVPPGVRAFISSPIAPVFTPIDSSPRHVLLAECPGRVVSQYARLRNSMVGEAGSNDPLTLRKGPSLLELLGDPPFDVTEPIPEVPACFEARRALSAVPPCVEGRNWNVQVDRELSHRQQLVESIHDTIVGAYPVSCWRTSSHGTGQQQLKLVASRRRGRDPG